MKEKELKLEIEELEERIAPSFMLIADNPANGAGQGGGQGTLGESFGPNSDTFPNDSASGNNEAGTSAWESHRNSPVLTNGDNN